jgi:hypothetical protein
MNNADEISQAERRRIMAEARRGLTYMGRAIATADEDRGGRFAVEGKSTITGSAPISYPQMPEGNPWRSDPVPAEPPLGYSVEDQEPVGELHEIEKSKRKE